MTMNCSNCGNKTPGAMIRVTEDGKCIKCGKPQMAKDLTQLLENNNISRWDKYFLHICEAVASKSACLSRQIGAIIVFENSVVSTGYNGPPRGFPHCEGTCPRRAKGYHSGEGLHECPAGHAEANAISNAARLGTSTNGCTLYLNTNYPCKDCMTAIVNAGIDEVVASIPTPYHPISIDIAHHGNVELRGFYL